MSFDQSNFIDNLKAQLREFAKENYYALIPTKQYAEILMNYYFDEHIIADYEIVLENIGFVVKYLPFQSYVWDQIYYEPKMDCFSKTENYLNDIDSYIESQVPDWLK